MNIKSMIMLMFMFALLFSCSKRDFAEENRAISKEFRRISMELFKFCEKNKIKNKKTRSVKLIKQYYKIAFTIIDYGEEHSNSYMRNYRQLRKRKIKSKANSFLNPKRVSYIYSRDKLKKRLLEELDILEKSETYFVSLNLTVAKIIKPIDKEVLSDTASRIEGLKKAIGVDD